MTWQSFYLGVFLLGFVLSIATLLAGLVHFPAGHGIHFGHGGFHGPSGFHGPGAAHGGSGVGHGVGHGPAPTGGGASGGQAGPAARGSGMSPINFATAMAFLAWFGAAGYLATSRAHVVWLAGLGLATAAGLLGAGLVFGFLAKVLARHDLPLDPADYRVEGALAKVIVPIREGGTGEISFSLGRTRRCAGARRDGPGALPKGVEVVVTRYEKGIAYVRPFETEEI
jgi:hypothetical protein